MTLRGERTVSFFLPMRWCSGRSGWLGWFFLLRTSVTSAEVLCWRDSVPQRRRKFFTWRLWKLFHWKLCNDSRENRKSFVFFVMWQLCIHWFLTIEKSQSWYVFAVVANGQKQSNTIKISLQCFQTCCVYVIWIYMVRLYMIYMFILCRWCFFDPGSGVLGLKLAACWGMPRSWNMFEYGTCWEIHFQFVAIFCCSYTCQAPCGWRVASRSPAQWQARQFRWNDEMKKTIQICPFLYQMTISEKIPVRFLPPWSTKMAFATWHGHLQGG